MLTVNFHSFQLLVFLIPFFALWINMNSVSPMYHCKLRLQCLAMSMWLDACIHTLVIHYTHMYVCMYVLYWVCVHPWLHVKRMRMTCILHWMRMASIGDSIFCMAIFCGRWQPPKKWGWVVGGGGVGGGCDHSNPAPVNRISGLFRRSLSPTPVH